MIFRICKNCGREIETTSRFSQVQIVCKNCGEISFNDQNFKKEDLASKPIFYSDNLKRYALIKKIAELENDYTIDDVEMCFIYHSLLKSGWNRAEAARKLGICIRKMRYRIAKMKTLGFVIADNPTIKKIK